MLSLPSRQEDVYPRDWQLLNTEYVIIGEITESGPDLMVRFELIDAFKNTSILRQRIVGKDLELRDMGHHVSDAIFELLTGVPGAFSTEILYITVVDSPSGRIFRLNVADADGQRVRTVLQSREPILSASWAPDGDRIAYVSFEKDSRPAIYIHNIRTRVRQQITDFKGLNGAPAFSPDGEN
jgi:TolB protein